MTDTAIEWRATNLVALGEELRDKIARVTRQFEQRASTARGQDEMGRLRARLSQIVESIQTSYRTHLERMSEDEQTRDEMPWCINTGKSLIPLTLRFLAQKRNLLIPLELSRVMHQGSAVPASA